jgi:hypothetical protein
MGKKRIEKQSSIAGKAVFFTREQIPGAMANGTVVEKCLSDPGDTHSDGDRATILGSIGEVCDKYGYFVEWTAHPGVPVFIASHRVRPVATP